MRYQVIYSSRTGHTKMIAETVASELGVEAEDLMDAELMDKGFVFLGTGCYGGEPSKRMMKFIEKNDFSSRSIALFGTSGSGGGSEVSMMEAELLSKGANIKGKFYCKGKILFVNPGRPNDDDINEARMFAKRMME